MFPWILCCILLIVVFFLITKIIFIEKSIDEIHTEFQERLSSDTNTLIDISSSDPHLRKLASEINIQLRLLRKERHRYQQGDLELKDRAAALQGELNKAQEATVNAEKFMNVVRKYLSIEELTHTLLREMVEKIVVYECEYDENEVRRQRIDIYYSFVGKIDLPEE